MSSVQSYWEKYRERNKSPAKAQVVEAVLNGVQRDRISELQSQVNILEDRIVNLARQVKLQNTEGFDIFDTITKINKIDKIIELQTVFNKKNQDGPGIESFQDFTMKVEKMIEKSEKKIIEFINDKFVEFDRKVRGFDEKIKNFEEKFKKNRKTEDLISQQFQELRSKIRLSSKSPENLKKKLEEFSEVQEKLQKIVINTAEKLKQQENHPKDPQEPSAFSKSLENISNLLKKYSKAQHLLFSDVKSLQEKTKTLENCLDSSLLISEQVRNEVSSHSFEDNFKLSFGSEESSKALRKKPF
jgi:DNA repair exonuclease SbcCD ATPase subunit